MTTWNQVQQTTGAGPVAAVAAGATLQAGWIDASGNQWQIAADGFFQNSVAPSPANPWQTSALKRPVAEAVIDGQIQARINYTPGTSQAVYLMLRITGNAGAFSGYIAAFNTNQVKAYKMTGGTPSAISMSGTGSFTPVLDTLYDMQFNLVTSGSSTILTFNVYAAGTSTLLYTSTATDSTVALQGVSGVAGICASNTTSTPIDTAQIITTYSSAGSVAASAFTMTGPTTGTVGTASTAFTVTPNGTIGASAVVVTSSDSAAGGTFTPASLSFASGATAAQTFTYTPGSVGTKTVSITNNGSLSNPSSISFTASASSAATAYTLTGPGTGVQGTASSAFTVTASGVLAAPVTITPSDNSGGGTFTPTTVSLATGTNTSATFTYTAASAGTKTISSTNSASLTNPSSLSYAVTALATTYTLTGPSTAVVGQASSNFTVTATGLLNAAVTVTPNDSGAGGTFSPTAVSLATGTNSAATFTYTPVAGATDTISTTNNASLTNPAGLSVLSTTSSTITVPVTSAAFRFSPGNWKGDTGRGGSVYRQTWNCGAYFEFDWLASSSPTAVILIPTIASNGCQVTYFLNGVMTDNVAATGNLSLTGILPNVTNVLTVCLRASTQSGRWNNGLSTLQIQGVQLDSGSSAGVAPTYGQWFQWVGDSITEGVKANASAGDHLADYSYLVAKFMQTLGYDYCISACASNGWLQPGDTTGDIPAWYNVNASGYQAATSRWNLIDQGVSILDSNGQVSAYGGTNQTPSVVFMNLMTNEAIHALSPAWAQTAVTQWITAQRAAAPNAHIFMQIPFGLYNTVTYPVAYIQALKAGILAYQTANPADTKVTSIDFGATFGVLMSTYTAGVQGYMNTDGIHPTVNGHALVAPMVANAISTALAADVAGVPVVKQPAVRYPIGL